MEESSIRNLFGDEVQQKEYYCTQCENYATNKCKRCEFNYYDLNSKPCNFKPQRN